MGFLKKLLRALLVGALVGVVTSLVFTLAAPEVFDRLEYQTYYYRCRLVRGRPTPQQKEALANQEPDVCLIDIDDRSMDKLGMYWGWNRGYHARMLDNLSKHYPASIGFDIFFDNPEDDRYQGRFDGVLEKASHGGGLSEELRRRILNSVDYDMRFVSATRRAGVVCHAVRMAETEDYAVHAQSETEHLRKYSRHELMNPASALSLPVDSFHGEIISRPILDGAFPSLGRASQSVGHANIYPNEDGFVREIPLLIRFGDFDAVYLPLSVRMCATVFGTPNDEIEFVPGKYLDIGTRFKVMRNEDGELECSYPNFRPELARLIIENAERILNPPEGEEFSSISSMAVLSTDSLGHPELVLDSDTLPYEVLTAVMNASWDSIAALPEGAEMDLGNEVVIANDGEGTYYLSAPYGAEAWYPWAPQINAFKQLATMWDGNGFGDRNGLLLYPFSVGRNSGTLVSNIPVLRDDVLEELCRTSWARLEALEPGQRVEFGERVRIPLTSNNRHIVTFFGPPRHTFRRYSFWAVHDDDALKGNLAGKLYLVGSTAPGLFDFVNAPVFDKYPGVEVHQSMIRSFIRNEFVHRLPSWANMVILVVAGMLIGVVAFSLMPLAGGIATLVLIGGYTLASVMVFEAGNVWIELARPVLVMIFSFASIMAYRYMTEEKDRKFLHSTFKTYLAPELIDQMYTKHTFPKLGGEERVLSAYFTDIQSFSTFSEKLGSPTRLVELLNEYLTAMTDILLEHRGTLDKYEGDAILAFFGAPMPMEDHALQACKTALAMQKRLGDLRQQWADEGDKWPQIVHAMRMRIGINTGPITVGNMGTPTRMDYTMMGDAVNLAARLESAAKQYGVYTMISNYTHELVEGAFEVRQLDKIQVVGRSEPVVVYELLAEKGALPVEYETLLVQYNHALELYYNREWEQAEKLLVDLEPSEPLRDIAPGGMSPSRRLLEYCRQCLSEPPGEDWDGVTRLTSK